MFKLGALDFYFFMNLESEQSHKSVTPEEPAKAVSTLESDLSSAVGRRPAAALEGLGERSAERGTD
jgi:hypothetical protein